MSRAIIQNSNYQSVDDAKAAIDRYFNERNAHFKSAAGWREGVGQGAGAEQIFGIQQL